MISKRLLALAAVLFFISGAAGLTYEVIWFKRFSQVWGSSALAAASVLASYLLGLGAGAGVLGRWADRTRSPLRGYGWCEAGIGLLALLVPYGARLLSEIAAALYPFLSGHPLLGSLARCFLTLLVLGPPCFLMGGTFPLLVRQFTPAGGTLREAVGILYAVNTLGGAAGAYLAGFHLLPALGLPGANGLAAGTNLAVAAAALVAARLWAKRGAAGAAPASPPPPPEREAAGGPGPIAARAIFAAAFLSGAAALGLQIAWTRQLSLILGGSTYAFSAMLLVVLLGIGLGSLLFHLWLKESKDLLWLQAGVVLFLLATALLGQRSIEPLTLAVAALGHFRNNPWWNAGISTAVAGVLEVLPCLGMGVLLPLYAAAGGSGSRRAGTLAGDLYGWNTLGTLLGAVGGALFLLPSFGVSATVAVSLGLYLVAAILLFPSRTPAGRFLVISLSAAGVVLVLLSSRGPDPVLTNLGMYLYGELDPELPKKVLRPLFIEEGVSSNVLVTAYRGGTISLRVNGKVDASTAGDMPTQLGSAYFPRFFHPAAREVLVIGFGSGTTSGASLLFPDTRVTCAEIEPAVVRASRHFQLINHLPLKSERFKLVLTDGRGHLQGSGTRYDLIISEPSNPWIAGVSNLFTREFYQAAADHLAPGGILAQWIQTYSLGPADFALMARTALSVFREGALFKTSAGDTILLASAGPLDPTSERLDRAQGLADSLPEVKADLERYFSTADVRSLLLSHRLLAQSGLERLLSKWGGQGIHTDSNLRLEFDAPLRLFDQGLLAGSVRKSLLACADTEAIPETWKRWGCTRAQLPALLELLDLFTEAEEWQPALKLIDFGLTIDPEEPHLLAGRFLSAMPGDGKGWDDSFSRILQLSAEEAARIGVQLYVRKDFERARRIWERLLQANPQSATLWVNLGATLEGKGDQEEARKAMEKAKLLDPFSSFVRSRAQGSGEEGGFEPAAPGRPPARGIAPVEETVPAPERPPPANPAPAPVKGPQVRE